jgi:hypothetical protein
VRTLIDRSDTYIQWRGGGSGGCASFLEKLSRPHLLLYRRCIHKTTSGLVVKEEWRYVDGMMVAIWVRVRSSVVYLLTALEIPKPTATATPIISTPIKIFPHIHNRFLFASSFCSIRLGGHMPDSSTCMEQRMLLLSVLFLPTALGLRPLFAVGGATGIAPFVVDVVVSCTVMMTSLSLQMGSMGNDSVHAVAVSVRASARSSSEARGFSAMVVAVEGVLWSGDGEVEGGGGRCCCCCDSGSDGTNIDARKGLLDCGGVCILAAWRASDNL